MTAGFPHQPLNSFLASLKKAYQGVDGYVLSGLGRQGLEPDEKEALTYGELPVPAFVELMEHCAVKPGESFIDLGAGLGQLVLAAAYCYKLKRAVGVERLPQLLGAAERAYQKISQEIIFPTGKIEFTHGDIETTLLNEYDVMLAHATCYRPETLAHLSNAVLTMKSGARVLVLGQKLDVPESYVREILPYQTRWHRHGAAHLYARP